MITKELVDFIKAEKTKGKNEEEIKTLLMQNSWNEGDIKEGFKAFKSILPFTAFKKSRLSIYFAILYIIVFLLIIFFENQIFLNNFLDGVISLVGLIFSLLILFTKNHIIYIIAKNGILLIFLSILFFSLLVVFVFAALSGMEF
ncbi:MAG: hypothetical protein WC011_03225 [Candidatus Paceibacterota bacterium]